MSRYGPPVNPNDVYSVLVTNLHFRTNADDLKDLFSKYGEVADGTAISAIAMCFSMLQSLTFCDCSVYSAYARNR